MAVTAIIKMQAKPGKRGELRAFIGPALEATATQAECLTIEALDCIEHPDELIIIERWTSVAAHQEFISGVIASGGLDGMDTLLAAEMETLHYAAVN